MDNVGVIETPEPLGSVGSFYDDFSHVSDDEVTKYHEKISNKIMRNSFSQYLVYLCCYLASHD